MEVITKKRIWELDFLRGFAIIMVLIDHAMYDFSVVFYSWATSGSIFLNNLYAIGESYMGSDIRIFWRPAFLFIFFFTSGICTTFSRNNFFRGIKLSIVAMLVSLVTYYYQYIVEDDSFILFGVLHCMAAIIIFYSLVEFLVNGAIFLISKITKKNVGNNVTKYALSFVCLILTIVFFLINKKYNVKLSDATAYYLTVPTDSKILGLFFYTDNWWTADYFPIFPFICFFFIGAAVAPLLYKEKCSLLPILDGPWHKVFTFAGKYSLWFYVLGQIILIALCAFLNIILL